MWNGHTFNNNFFGNFKFASAPSNFSLYMKNDNPELYDYGTGLWMEGSSYGYTDINLRSRYQYQADFTMFLDDFGGQHEWKAGVSYSTTKNTRGFHLNGEESTQQAGYKPLGFYYYNGNPYAVDYYKDTDMLRACNSVFAFIQDTWSPIPRLTLTLGLRFESSRGIIPAQNENSVGYFLPEFLGTAYPLQDAVPEDLTVMKWNQFAPRLGFSFDVSGDGKTVIKGSYGIYHDALLAQYFSNANPNGFADFWGIWDPDTLAVTRLGGFDLPEASQVGYKGKEPSAPYEQQFTVSIERELFEDWSLTVRGIFKQRKNLLEEVDAASLDMDALMNDGTLIWKNWQQVPVTDPVTGNTLNFWEMIDPLKASELVIVNIPDEANRYKALELVLNKRFSRGWMLEMSYILSRLEGFIDTGFNETSTISSLYNNPNFHVNAYGRLPNDRRHYFKMLAMARGPWGINVSGVAQYYSGNTYSRYLLASQHGITLNGLTDASIIADAKRGQYELPSIFLVDAALEKEFKMKNLSLTVFANAFNLFNEGKATLVETTSQHRTRSFGQMRSINAPFYLRLGARITFN